MSFWNTPGRFHLLHCDSVKCSQASAEFKRVFDSVWLNRIPSHVRDGILVYWTPHVQVYFKAMLGTNSACYINREQKFFFYYVVIGAQTGFSREVGADGPLLPSAGLSSTLTPHVGRGPAATPTRPDRTSNAL
jgi:hypothetical protein